MNKNEDTVLEKVKKPASKTRKTAATATADDKVKNTAATKKAKTKAPAKSVQDMSEKLLKAVNSKKRVHIEFYGKQVSEDHIAEKLVETLKENGFKSTIKSLEIYYKVEENTAYCVVNDGEPIVISF